MPAAEYGRVSRVLWAALASVPLLIGFKFAATVLLTASAMLVGWPAVYNHAPVYLWSLVDWLLPVARGPTDLSQYDYAADDTTGSSRFIGQGPLGQ